MITDPTHADEQVFADQANTAEEYEPLRVRLHIPQSDVSAENPSAWARRTIRRYMLIMGSEGPRVKLDQSVYLVNVDWDVQLLELALVADIRGVVEVGVNVLPDTDTLCVQRDGFEMDAMAWEGWDALKSVTYSVKGSDDKKSRTDRVSRLLTERRLLGADLVAANGRLRTLKNTSPQPHGETSEMTFGSTVEINSQMDVIKAIEDSIAGKTKAIAEQIAKLNETLTTPEDSGWQVQLPDLIAELTELNDPISKEHYDANYSPLSFLTLKSEPGISDDEWVIAPVKGKTKAKA